MPPQLRKIVILVGILNLAYFGVEFAVALHIGSVSLFADSVDFLEDASVNFLIALALGWSATARARLGMALAGILLVPGLATLWTAFDKFMSPSAARTFAPDGYGRGRPCRQSHLRPHAGAVPRPWRQPHPRGLLVGAQ